MCHDLDHPGGWVYIDKVLMLILLEIMFKEIELMLIEEPNSRKHNLWLASLKCE